VISDFVVQASRLLSLVQARRPHHKELRRTFVKGGRFAQFMAPAI